MLSREGPRAAVGDVNWDGLPDIYIGGASGQAGQLYLQTPSGAFVSIPKKPSISLPIRGRRRPPLRLRS